MKLKNYMTLSNKAVLIIVLVLIIDQVIKIWVKTDMHLGESRQVFGNWFYIRFIENPGMAFGKELPGKFGKLALSLFRLAAIVIIIIFLRNLIKKKAPQGVVICLSLILAGAIGNMIDSAFYGLIFSESLPYPHLPAKFMPEGGGYAPLLHAKVVDMFYFPVIEGFYPEWSPIKPGERFIFFRPIFNIADSAISVGVITILLFQRKYFKHL